MCVVSGRHMEADDWCICPNSNMPALLSQYHAYLESEAAGAESVEAAAAAAAEAAAHDSKIKASFKSAVRKVVQGSDPVCGKLVSTEQLAKSSAEDVKAYIKAYNAQDAADP